MTVAGQFTTCVPERASDRSFTLLSTSRFKSSLLPSLLSTAVASTLFGFSTTAVAQDTAADRVFEEVIVTARQREEKAQSVPIPITALSSSNS